MELQRASDELVQYAIASRPDWTADEVRQSIADMTSRGVPWQTIHMAVTRVMCSRTSMPRDALPARPWRGEPVRGERVHELADACRAELTRGDE